MTGSRQQKELCELGARGLGRIWCKGGGREGQQLPHLCGLLGRGANGFSKVWGLEIREPLNSRTATYLRGHVDQTIHFIVGDTKAQRGEGTG